MDSLVSRVARRLADRGQPRGAGSRQRPARLVVAGVLGVLVFMTIWGFGRAAFPAASDGWRTAGMVAAAITIVVRSRPPRPR